MKEISEKTKLENSLAHLNPELASEWHPSKNGELTPYDVSPNSGKSVWWKCPKGDDHEWQAVIHSRNNGAGCSICANRTVVKSNCLATLNPELAKEWHPTKNGTLTPYDVIPGSSKKAWWKCPKGDDHEWEAEIRSRTIGAGCPVCSNKLVTKSNCLAVLNPELAKEWHPTKNGKLTPYDVTPGSATIVWWKCPKDEDHEWEAALKDRNLGHGCSICAGKVVVPSISLSTLNPVLAKEWHPKKNNPLTPDNVTPGSNKKVWWKCPKGDDHEWKAIISDRNRGDGCPVCSNHKAVNSNCLATINPKLAKEWHPTKNGELTPYDVLPGSSKKVWWKCPEGEDHIWKVSVNNRTNGTGCPICANKKVTEFNCLATLNPELAKEWHPTKNEKLTANDVTPGSNEKVWWKCLKGLDHEWQASVYSRTKGNGCAVCANLIVVKSNCLATLRPDLAEEWHPTKNGKLTPHDVGSGSSKKVWWKCPEGDEHEWKTTVIQRSNGTGCPICSNRIIVPNENSLAALNPELAKEWHPTKNGRLTPYDVGPGSRKKVWWKCPKGEDHEWKATISSRSNGYGCSVCANITVVESNSLAILRPDLAAEWHPAKNGELTPNDVGLGSGKKVWWMCKKGHEWKISPHHRKKGHGCPYCRNASSGPELRILCELATIFPNIQHRTKINGFEVDLLIPELQVGIEYDGEYWHRNKIEQDIEKNVALQDQILLIRIRDKGLPLLSQMDIEQKTVDFTIDIIKEILLTIKRNGKIGFDNVEHKIQEYLTKSDWVANDIFNEKYAARDHINYEESLSYLYPEIAQQWHSTKNAPLLPEYYRPGSNVKVWWKCPEGDDHVWQTTIGNRALSGRGCPICNNSKVVKSNCLATVNPELAKEWHPSKNGRLTPYDITPGSVKKAWWKGECGHEWKAVIAGRNKGIGCPVCCNKLVTESNSLSMLNPDLAKEWHPTKNGKLTPDDVPPGSHKKVWWKCPEADDHGWKAQIKARNNGCGCPMCANKILVKSNSLATLNPEIALEWHPSKNGDLSPDDFTSASTKKVWWLGQCGHEWEARINNRTKRGQGCPQCKGKRISQTKRLNNEDPRQLKLF